MNSMQKQKDKKLEQDHVYSLYEMKTHFELKDTGIKFADLRVFQKEKTLFCFRQVDKNNYSLQFVCPA